MHKVKFKRRILGGWGTGFLGLNRAEKHVLDMRNAPPGDIVFELDNGAVRDGYHFNTKAKDDAIWVKVDDGACPSGRSSHPDIDNIRVEHDRVTVTNRKCSGPVSLRYQLNVLDGSNQGDAIDPIIEN